MIRAPFRFPKKKRHGPSLTELSGLFADPEGVEELRTTLEQKIAELDLVIAYAQQIKGAQGAKGERGPKGERGEKGDSIVGPQGEQGIPGIPGKDGESVVGPSGRDGKDGVSPDPLTIIELLKEQKLLKPEHIDGLKEEIASYRQQLAGAHYGKDTLVRGGGDSVAAGSGITITATNGVKTISAPSAAGTRVVDEVPSGSGVTFTLAQTPLVSTLQLYRGGSRITTTNSDYTLSGATITLTVALGTGETLTADYSY